MRVTRIELPTTYIGAMKSNWTYITGGIIGGLIGAAAGTPLTISSFYYFLAARLGPVYNGEGKSVFYGLLILPIVLVWGFVTGGALLSFAMWYVGGNNRRQSVLIWAYGATAILIVPLIFWSGCTVLGFALHLLALLII